MNRMKTVWNYCKFVGNCLILIMYYVLVFAWMYSNPIENKDLAENEKDDN